MQARKWKRVVKEDEFLGPQVEHTLDTRVKVTANAHEIKIDSLFLAADFDAYLEFLQVTKFAWMHHRSIKLTGKIAQEDDVEYIEK